MFILTSLQKMGVEPCKFLSVDFIYIELFTRIVQI